MKWLALLAGGALVLVLLAWLLPRGEPPLGVATSRAIPVPLSPPAEVAPAQGLPTPAPRIALHGVVWQGAQSQALLSVAGLPVQVFRQGDMVHQGWKLDTIAVDHVLVAKDGSSVRLDVVTAPALAASSAASDLARAKPSALEQPLPGFVKGPPPASYIDPGPSRERNRRFLQDRQNRAGQQAPP